MTAEAQWKKIKGTLKKNGELVDGKIQKVGKNRLGTRKDNRPQSPSHYENSAPRNLLRKMRTVERQVSIGL